MSSISLIPAGIKSLFSILDFLQVDDVGNLEIIGSWYFRFLDSNLDKVCVQLPFYTKDIADNAFKYVRALTIVYYLIKEDGLSEFQGTCLFDVFNQTRNSTIRDLILSFVEKRNEVVRWGDITLTLLDKFLPVFNESELIGYNNPEKISNSFSLYRYIRNYKILNYPQLIN